MSGADRWRASRGWVDRHRGWSGLVVGGVVGLCAGLVAASVAPAGGAGELEDGVITIMSGLDQTAGGQHQSLIDQWNATHATQARIIPLSTSTDNAHSDMLKVAESGRSDVDIYNLDSIWIAEFAEAGFIRPLARDRVDLGGFLEKPLLTCEYDGQLWALPFNTDAGLLYYRDREDLPLVEAPTSWERMQAATTSALNSADPRYQEIEAGFVTQLGNYEGLTVNALEAIWAAGGDVVDANLRVVIDSQQAEEGLRLLAEGLGPDGTRFVLPDSLSSDEARSTQAFADRRTLYLRNWPVAYRQLWPDSDQPPKVRFHVTTLPNSRSVLGGQNLAISSRSQRPRAALALIEFLTSERSQQILFERGGFAATREIVYRDPLITSTYPYAATLLNAVKAARLRPVTPHYTLFSEVFRRVVREALAPGNNGEITPRHVAMLSAALSGKPHP